LFRAQGTEPAREWPKAGKWRNCHDDYQEAIMHVEGFFEWLGQALGALIRFVVDGLNGLFSLLSNAGGSFIEGLSRTLGMDTSLVSILTLIVGLLVLYSAVRAFMRASIIIGIIWLLLGLWILSWVVH
jgi:phage shock protein PspC (stress-responsive transcriptional regulator)